MPKRIQRKRTKGWRMPEGAVYVGRPTRWGNLFVVDTRYRGYGNCELVVTSDLVLPLFHIFATMLNQFHPEWLEPLRGKDLACWCKEGTPCHADILLEMANQ